MVQGAGAKTAAEKGKVADVAKVADDDDTVVLSPIKKSPGRAAQPLKLDDMDDDVDADVVAAKPTAAVAATGGGDGGDSGADEDFEEEPEAEVEEASSEPEPATRAKASSRLE